MIGNDKMQVVVAAYFIARKEVEELRARHKAELEPWEKYMEQCARAARVYLAAYEVNSAPFLTGTIYGRRELHARVSDRDKLFEFVTSQGRFELLPAAVKKEEVWKYREANPKAPDIPGVDVDYELKIRFVKPDDNPIGDEIQWSSNVQAI